MNAVRVLALTGSDLGAKVREIARLRIELFREYPYRYHGNFEYEENYLRGLTLDPDALVIVAEVDDEIIAAATSIPLLGPADITVDASPVDLFKSEGLDASTFYYYSEILVKPAYRNAGLARDFYRRREAFAKQRGYLNLCFATIVLREESAVPADYFDPSPMWQKLGFTMKPNLRFKYGWPTIQTDGSVSDQQHEMVFWISTLGSKFNGDN